MDALSDKCSANKTVMHLIDTTGPGGAETVFIDLADKMRNFGYRSITVVRGKGWVYDELCKRDLKPIIMPAKGSFNVKFVWSLLKLVRVNRVALIQSHLLGSNVYAAIVGILSRVPVVATYHGMVDVSPNERFKRAKHWVMQHGISHYVTVSQRLAKNVQAQGLLDPAKSSTIYNGIDISRYEKMAARPLVDELGIAQDSVLVGSVGNVRAAKDYAMLVKVAAIVVEQNAKVHFVIAGHQKAELMDELNKLILKLGLTSNVHFIGFCDDSAQFLAQMDIFALSSKSEGFSISTIEGMATGLPVLVTRCGGPEEIVSHGETGWLVEPQSETVFANALLMLLSDESLREKLGEAGKKAVAAKFDLTAMLGAYDAHYKKLVQ
jgi:glycosyltransferase involved in cell wall biosynthesis